jgi:dolichyl-phosphate beta-glucosyltransferase
MHAVHGMHGARPESASPRVIELSYVVPACNSAATIEATLRTLATTLDGRSVEIVVVQNGSTDGTSDLLSTVQATWAHKHVSLVVIDSDKGLGHAYRTGIAASHGERVVLTADDLPFGFDDLEASDALDAVAHPIVIGSKGHRNSVVERGGLRALLSAGFWLLRRSILGMRTLDPQGTFIIAGDWARQVVAELTEPGYLVTTELCYLAERSGIEPVEVPVRLSAAHGAHRSRVKPGDVWRMGAGLVGIRRRHAHSRVLRAVRRIPAPVVAIEETAA